jgi:hypothetical protein
VTKHPLLRWRGPPSARTLGSNRSSGRRWPAGVALFALLALLIASTAQADSPRHMHDYLAVSQQARIAAVSPDLADHAAIRQLVGDLANSATIARHQHDHLASTSATASAAAPIVVASPIAASGSAASSSFGWGDFGIGIGTGIGAMLILLGFGTAAVIYRRRARKEAPVAAA